MIKIVLTGTPAPAGRPRFRIVRSKKGGQFVSTYNDPEMVKYQTALRIQGQEAMNGAAPLTGPLTVTMRVYLRIPQSLSVKKQELALAGAIRPITRPDLDNYVKQLDSLNGVCWLDDSQIVILKAIKLYSDRPSIEIEIDQVHGEQTQQPMPLFEGKA